MIFHSGPDGHGLISGGLVSIGYWLSSALRFLSIFLQLLFPVAGSCHFGVNVEFDAHADAVHEGNFSFELSAVEDQRRAFKTRGDVVAFA